MGTSHPGQHQSRLPTKHKHFQSIGQTLLPVRIILREHCLCLQQNNKTVSNCFELHPHHKHVLYPSFDLDSFPHNISNIIHIFFLLFLLVTRNDRVATKRSLECLTIAPKWGITVLLARLIRATGPDAIHFEPGQ